jgi:hypothetical protein
MRLNKAVNGLIKPLKGLTKPLKCLNMAFKGLTKRSEPREELPLKGIPGRIPFKMEFIWSMF